MPRLILRVTANSAGIRLATDALDRFRADHGLGDAVAWPAHVSLDELLSNIVRHATAGKVERIIEVSFTLQDDRLETTVVDDGPEFDPLQVAAPDVMAPLEDRPPGGLGIYLVRELMERVDYTRAEGRNRLVMTLRLPRPASTDP